jgi:trans-2,3-dihydro-3-hydroxyanthranilate isomerase
LVSSLPYTLLDVFTDEPLTGNQLAVFAEAADISDRRMGELAREMNLSETVFVLDPESGGDHRLRIFTPVTELPFAGHPVLGSAVLLGLRDDRDQLTFECGAGPVAVEIERLDRNRGRGRMTQPMPTWEPLEDGVEATVLSAIGFDRAALPLELYDNGPHHTYVELPDEDRVAALRPDFSALAEIDLLVSCYAIRGERVRVRMFAPASGVAEDPATGSAAGPLVVHLARHGRIQFGTEIEISQGIELSRPSTLHAVAHGTAENVDRVEVSGSAVIVASGSFTL